MASDFLELLERVRAGENLPSRQASSFPASIGAPFSPQQQGFLFSQNAVSPIEPVQTASLPRDPGFFIRTEDDGGGPIDEPDVENLPGTAENIIAAFTNPFALLAGGFGEALNNPNKVQINPFTDQSLEAAGMRQLANSFGFNFDVDPTAPFRFQNEPGLSIGDADFGVGSLDDAPGLSDISDIDPGSFDAFGGGGEFDDVGPGGFGVGSLDDDPGLSDLSDIDTGAFDSFDGGFDDDSGDAGDDKIICAELYRQGYMPDHIYEADEAYGAKLPSNVLRGYHWWANPAVRWMKRSRFATGLARKIALPWAHHMAYLMGAEEKDNRVGRLIMVVGYPLCRFIGDVLDVREAHTARRGIDGVPGSN